MRRVNLWNPISGFVWSLGKVYGKIRSSYKLQLLIFFLIGFSRIENGEGKIR
jgi:hypothetical protein